MHWIKKISFVLIILGVQMGYSQTSKVIAKTYTPQDKGFKELESEIEANEGNYADKGKTTYIIDVTSPKAGHQVFMFKEKTIREDFFQGDSTDVWGNDAKGIWKVLRKEYTESYTLTIKNLYAYILQDDHGGYIEKNKFQDFGNEVYFPDFQYNYCQVHDADHDGTPEFYLTYFGHSDGLDAKPIKVIVYNNAIKYKVTGYIPAGNEEEVYHVEYDSNWKTLPKAIQEKGKNILNTLKKQILLNWE